MFFVCACLALAGCKITPRSVPMELTEEERATLRAFPTTVAFEMEQSVVFTLRGRDFAGMGVTRIEPDGSFASSCVTAQGMTLFEIAGQGERLDFCRVLPGMGETEKVAAMFAECIRNVYFGDMPASDAIWYRNGDNRDAFLSLKDGDWSWEAFSSLEDGGWLRHRFNRFGRLVEKKKLTRRGGLAWMITYDDYDMPGPNKIEVRDHTQRYPYTLNLRVTTWRGVAEEEP